MPAYHITGPSGSGKSTVGRVLQQQGFRVIETDFEDDLSDWFDTQTHERVTELPKQPYPKEWAATHRWFWDASRMSELLDSVGDEPVFFCGGANNEGDFWNSFRLHLGLCVDGPTLKKRLQPREPERWVDGSAELKRNLEWNEKFRQVCIATGTIVIDSLVSPDIVADTILRHVQN